MTAQPTTPPPSPAEIVRRIHAGAQRAPRPTEAALSLELVEVTPEMAAAWLELNTSNRPLSRTRVQTLATAMRRGQWRVTHQGIAFRRDGRLSDGQHRLAAIVESGVTVQMYVAYGMDHFDLVDIGKTRTIGEILGILGYRNAVSLGAALRLLQMYDSGESRPWGDARRAMAPADLEGLAAVHGEPLQPFIVSAHRITKRIGGGVAATSSGLYVCSRWATQHDATDLFAEWTAGLELGAGLAAGDGRLALASWLSGAARNLHQQVRAELTLMLVIRTFHAAVTGESLGRLLVRNPSEFVYRLPERA